MQFEPALDDSACMKILNNNWKMKNEAIVFANNSLEGNKKTGDDFRELLELMRIFCVSDTVDAAG